MLTRRSLLATFAAAPALILASNSALAAEPEIFAVDGVAIRGTDPVGYFNQSQPVAGTTAYKTDWKGATWHFSDAASRDAFAANPDRFSPEFGGYCAYAASKGYLAPTIPEAWTVYENRLYLNANLRARELWLQDVPGNIAKGRANWPGILG